MILLAFVFEMAAFQLRRRVYCLSACTEIETDIADKDVSLDSLGAFIFRLLSAIAIGKLKMNQDDSKL